MSLPIFFLNVAMLLGEGPRSHIADLEDCSREDGILLRDCSIVTREDRKRILDMELAVAAK